MQTFVQPRSKDLNQMQNNGNYAHAFNFAKIHKAQELHLPADSFHMAGTVSTINYNKMFVTCWDNR